MLLMFVAAIVLSGMRQPVEQVAAQDKQAKTVTQARTLRPAQAANIENASLKYVPANSVFCIVIRPAAIADVKGAEKMAALAQETMNRSKTGLSLKDLDQLTIVGFPVEGARGPMGDEPIVIMTTTKANDFGEFIKSTAVGSEERGYKGETYLAKQGIRTSAYYRPDDRTMITGPENSIQALIDATTRGAAKPDWSKDFADVAGSHMAFVVNMAAFRPEIQEGMKRGPAAAMLGAFSPLWEDTNTIVGSISIGEKSKLFVSAFCTDKQGAKRVKNTVEALIPLGKNFIAQTEAVFANVPNVPPEVKQALALAKRALEEVKINSKGKLASLAVEIGDNGVPMMVALLLPAVQSAREAARRAMAKNNMKQLMLAMHNYHDTHKEFPKPVMLGPDGKTKHSWRVALLPYLAQNELYKQYNLNEPWDSENNKKVLARIPGLYRNPNADANSTETSYLALVGNQTALGDGEKAVRIRDMTDGTSNTVMLFEVRRKIPWTKPVDIAYDTKGDLPELKGFHQGGYHVGICDGSVRFIFQNIDEKVLRALISRNGGEVIGEF
jgi:hypothetical protein